LTWILSQCRCGHSQLAELQCLTLPQSSDEPGLWGRLAVGTHLDSATIHVRRPGVSPTEYLTYTLSNVTIVSFTTSSTAEVPQDTIQLAYDAVSESYKMFNSAGQVVATNTAQYNRVNGTSSATGTLTATSASTPQLGLSLVEGGVTAPELEVGSYSWGGSNPSGGAATSSLQKSTRRWLTERGYGRGRCVHTLQEPHLW
jgi:type VI protein secretion system component Hcp